MSEIVRVNNQVQSAADLKSHVASIHSVMKEVMINGTHYGTISGCGNKPVLLKPGAEKILATFMLATEFEIEDISTPENKYYRITTKLIHQGSGVYMGSGIGECSSLENKYAWRAAVCDEEFIDTPENMRRIHYKKGYQGSAATKVNQVRQDMHTLANTILKMAKKRSLIDAVMNVTACSDIFDQDVDESHIKEAVMGDTPEPPKKEPVRITAAIIVKAMSGSKDLKELDEKLKKSNTTEFANDPTITAAYEKRKAELNA
tara:strand:- start:1177 stop:1956 length:780 start_codon:yes stop_codon:yes gene_type:complete